MLDSGVQSLLSSSPASSSAPLSALALGIHHTFAARQKGRAARQSSLAEAEAWQGRFDAIRGSSENDSTRSLKLLPRFVNSQVLSLIHSNANVECEISSQLAYATIGSNRADNAR